MAQTNFAVDKAIGDAVRNRAKEIGANVVDVTNQLLEYGLKHADLYVETKVVRYAPRGDDTAEPKDETAEPKDKPKRGRGRPPKK